MSLMRMIRAQLGLMSGGNESQNHFLDGSVPNQLTLKRGVPDVPGATVMQVVDGKVVALASPQIWQNFFVPADRQSGVEYTNDTGLPIDVAVIIQNTSAVGYMSIQIETGPDVAAPGLIQVFTITTTTVQEAVSICGRIPAGHKYCVTWSGNNGPVPVFWKELR